MSRRYIDTSLGQMHLRIEGAGPPLLLLGSAGRSLRVFDRLIPLLRDQFTLIAPDLFGSGNSDPLPAGATITALAGCMDQALESLGIAKAHAYGFHTGNKIGAALAAGWPTRVDKLVLAGQNHSLIPSNEERNRVIGGRTQNYFADQDRSDPVAKDLRAWATLQRNVASLWWPDALINGTAHRPRALAQARAQVLDELQCFDGIPALYQTNFAYDLEADLRRITAPTLVLEISTPDENKKLGAQAPKVCALIPGSASQTMQADGFRLTLEDQAEELAGILRGFFTASRQSWGSASSSG